ncbi:DUF4189 domain-containing protein [Pseudoxanthomonas gei]|nr:DUF4189 domain-containing protein [Pseudoxanthomonas gei]
MAGTDIMPEEQITQMPAGAWKTKWSAIAVDPVVGDVGLSTGHGLEEDAKAEAMRRCARHGAQDCKASSYFNQCSALAWPALVGGSAASAGAGSLEAAKALALSSCAANGGGKCSIVAEQCANPVFEKY